MVCLNIPHFESKNIFFPKICCIEQKIPTPRVDDIEQKIHKELSKISLQDLIEPGQTIAITASSRGIPNQALILKNMVKFFKSLKSHPFIIPAMGSHGGGTVEGQMKILQEYGITEESIGCPIKATMDVVEIGISEFGTPIYLDKFASQADKIFLLNRIKSHSKFVGEVESGLTKMLIMGLGKHKGAKQYHKLLEIYSWPEIVSKFRTLILEKCNIIGGLAIIQNIENQIAEIHAVFSEDFAKIEPKLLKRYKELTEKMPFKNIDLLIVDEMGKNIFGTGMDTNITGRKPSSALKIKWLFIRDLTDETNGNAQGIGLADFTTEKLVAKIDLNQTYVNALTAYRTDSPKLPIILPNDESVLKAIAEMYGVKEISSLRIVWLKNTSELKRMLISEAFFDQINLREELQYISDPESIHYDIEGNLTNSNKSW